MKKISYIFLSLIVCVLGIFAFSFNSVNAKWFYGASKPTLPFSISFHLEEKVWDGSEILPDDEEAGLDHKWLIENLVEGEANGKEIGLNNPDSALNEYINNRLKGGWGWKRDYFGSMAVTGEREMEELFGAAAKGLSFIIQVESTNVYYIYTTSIDLGERGEANWLGTSNKTPGKPTVPIGEYVDPVYRTKLVRASASDSFEIVETKQGKARSDWYDENRSNANITQIPAFDIMTWTET